MKPTLGDTVEFKDLARLKRYGDGIVVSRPKNALGGITVVRVFFRKENYSLWFNESLLRLKIKNTQPAHPLTSIFLR